MSQIHFFSFLNFAIFRAFKKGPVPHEKRDRSHFCACSEGRSARTAHVRPGGALKKKQIKLLKIQEKSIAGTCPRTPTFCKKFTQKCIAKIFFMIKSKKSCKNWKKVGSNFEKFDEKFDSNLIQIWIWKKIQIQAKLIWIWIWKIFQIGFKFESDLSLIFDSFLLLLCEIWMFADLAGI